MERDTWERERAAPDAGIDWMRALADRFRAARRRHPEDALTIVFDIDGTILDMRHMIRHVLIGYDGAHGTDHFTGLNADDIRVHENHVDRFLAGLELPEAERRAIHAWYLERRWAPESILASHRPYRGVMEVIRWFMLQPRTHVGLNTGRPEPLREDTLRSLNALGREYRVAFDPSLLEMNARGWERQVAEGKAAALARFRARGYRVFAVVDNEPGNIARMIEADEEEEILFLHADTIFLSQAAGTPRTVSGRRYALANLISERDVRERVTLVWHGINDAGNLRQFLASSVHWGECDVRRDPRGRLVSRHDSFERSPWRSDEPPPAPRPPAARDGAPRQGAQARPQGGRRDGGARAGAGGPPRLQRRQAVVQRRDRRAPGIRLPTPRRGPPGRRPPMPGGLPGAARRGRPRRGMQAAPRLAGMGYRPLLHRLAQPPPRRAFRLPGEPGIRNQHLRSPRPGVLPPGRAHAAVLADGGFQLPDVALLRPRLGRGPGLPRLRTTPVAPRRAPSPTKACSPADFALRWRAIGRR